jgi:uncharacterized membrane protein YfhO
VKIDGREAKGLRADYLVRAVAVPAGRHTVVWEFHDPAFERGLVVSLGSFAAILLLYFASWWLGRRRGAGAGTTPAAAAAAPGAAGTA